MLLLWLRVWFRTKIGERSRAVYSARLFSCPDAVCPRTVLSAKKEGKQATSKAPASRSVRCATGFVGMG